MARLAATIAGALVVAGGCSAGASDDGMQRSAFEAAECPQDVTAVVVANVTCGYLTVPEKRTAEDRRSIRLFVARIQPPGDTPRDEPMFVVGTDLASQPNYGGIAPLAQRVGREVIILDARGTGHSEPNLDCPEVEALADAVLAVATDDEAMRARYLDAVASCHDRLTSSGIDVSAYNLTEMAADAGDLRIALGIETWNIVTYGTASRIALEMLREAPDHIRAVLLDSPEVPGDDPRAVAVQGTRGALDAVLSACADDPACAVAYPGVAESLATALDMLDDQPVTLTATVPGRSAGEPIPIHMDDALLLRLLRHILADGGSSGGLFVPGAVPALINAVVSGRLPEYTQAMAPAFASEQPYCVGYQPRCLPVHDQTLGVTYSVLCSDIAPPADPAAPVRLAGDAPGFAEAYGRSPFLDVCDQWPVEAASDGTAEPVRTDVPTLVTIGAFGPYSPEDQVRAGLAGLTSATLVVDPAGGHNVIPRTDCMVEIRGAWLDDLSLDADEQSCLESVRVNWTLP